MDTSVIPPPAAGKPKVLFVLGATATGKSTLAIALAARFGGEVINCDKIQVYDGLPVITNKVTDVECAGVWHHLLSCVVLPDADDFRREAVAAMRGVLSRGRIHVVAGGSIRYIEALVDDCFFIWLDAAPEVLRWCTAARVDDMVRRGLVEEARVAFDPTTPAASAARSGCRRWMRAELEKDGGAAAVALLANAVEEMKGNTYELALAQVEKMKRLSTLEGWDVRRMDSTDVLGRMADSGGGVDFSCTHMLGLPRVAFSFPNRHVFSR